MDHANGLDLIPETTLLAAGISHAKTTTADELLPGTARLVHVAPDGITFEVEVWSPSRRATGALTWHASADDLQPHLEA